MRSFFHSFGAPPSVESLNTIRIDRAQPFDTGVTLGDEWDPAPDMVDGRALAIESVHPSAFRFEFGLQGSERMISGHERLDRLRVNESLIRVDAQMGMALLTESRQRFLRCLGLRSLDFPGAVFVHKDTGRRFVMGAMNHGGHFDRHMFPLSSVATTSTRPSLVLPIELLTQR